MPGPHFGQNLVRCADLLQQRLTRARVLVRKDQAAAEEQSTGGPRAKSCIKERGPGDCPHACYPHAPLFLAQPDKARQRTIGPSPALPLAADILPVPLQQRRVHLEQGVPQHIQHAVHDPVIRGTPLRQDVAPAGGNRNIGPLRIRRSRGAKPLRPHAQQADRQAVWQVGPSKEPNAAIASKEMIHSVPGRV